VTPPLASRGRRWPREEGEEEAAWGLGEEGRREGTRRRGWRERCIPEEGGEERKGGGQREDI